MVIIICKPFIFVIKNVWVRLIKSTLVHYIVSLFELHSTYNSVVIFNITVVLLNLNILTLLVFLRWVFTIFYVYELKMIIK